MSAKRISETCEVEIEHGRLVIASDVSLVGAAVVTTLEEGMALLNALLGWMLEMDRRP